MRQLNIAKLLGYCDPLRKLQPAARGPRVQLDRVLRRKTQGVYNGYLNLIYPWRDVLFYTVSIMMFDGVEIELQGTSRNFVNRIYMNI